MTRFESEYITPVPDVKVSANDAMYDDVYKTIGYQKHQTIGQKEVDMADARLDKVVDNFSMSKDLRSSVNELQGALLSGDMKDFQQTLGRLSDSSERREAIKVLNAALIESKAGVLIGTDKEGNTYLADHQVNGSVLKFNADGTFADRFVARQGEDGRLHMEGPYRGGPVMAGVFQRISDTAVRNLDDLPANTHRWNMIKGDGLMR